MEEEKDLVRRAQKGDRSAFALLYERYFERVYRYLVARLSNPTEAEDLAQEVFLRVLEALPRFRFRGPPFSAWIFRIAHNLVVDRYRRTGHAGEVLPLDTVLGLPSGQDVPAQAILALEAQALGAALARLTEAQRQVLLLRFVAGLSVRETAQAMGKSENAVKALQHAGLLALRRHLAHLQETPGVPEAPPAS